MPTDTASVVCLLEEVDLVCLNVSVQNAPHTMKQVTGSDWNMPYSREQAAFPAVS